jgi:hypothetical protein
MVAILLGLSKPSAGQSLLDTSLPESLSSGLYGLASKGHPYCALRAPTPRNRSNVDADQSERDFKGFNHAWPLQVAHGKASATSDLSQHDGPYFFLIVEGEGEIRPIRPDEGSMGAPSSGLCPSDSKQSCQELPGLNGPPVHAA